MRRARTLLPVPAHARIAAAFGAAAQQAPAQQRQEKLLRRDSGAPVVDAVELSAQFSDAGGVGERPDPTKWMILGDKVLPIIPAPVRLWMSGE